MKKVSRYIIVRSLSRASFSRFQAVPTRGLRNLRGLCNLQTVQPPDCVAGSNYSEEWAHLNIILLLVRLRRCRHSFRFATVLFQESARRHLAHAKTAGIPWHRYANTTPPPNILQLLEYYLSLKDSCRFGKEHSEKSSRVRLHNFCSYRSCQELENHQVKHCWLVDQT